MKKYLFLITIAVLSFASAHAQTTPASGNVVSESDSNQVFTAVQEPASFPGGYTKFIEFIKDNIHKPAVAPNGNRLEIIMFVIEKDGSIDNFQILRGLGEAYDAEALRVLKLSPKWKPGKQNGHLVRVLYTVPVSFE